MALVPLKVARLEPACGWLLICLQILARGFAPASQFLFSLWWHPPEKRRAKFDFAFARATKPPSLTWGKFRSGAAVTALGCAVVGMGSAYGRPYGLKTWAAHSYGCCANDYARRA